MRMVRGRGGVAHVVFDSDSMAQDTRDSLERAQLREHVRLLYVTLTALEGRPRHALVCGGT